MHGTQKTYGQYCGCARALDLVGERWTILLIREMLLGPRRFTQFLDWLPGLTPNLLTRRLKSLEGKGLINRFKDPLDGRVKLYSLTEAGQALESVVMSLGAWGQAFNMGPPKPEDLVNIGWGLISLKRRYVGGMACTVELQHSDGRCFQQKLTAGYVELREDCPWMPDLTISFRRLALPSLLFKNSALKKLQRDGLTDIVGDDALAKAWCTSFGIAFE